MKLADRIRLNDELEDLDTYERLNAAPAPFDPEDEIEDAEREEADALDDVEDWRDE